MKCLLLVLLFLAIGQISFSQEPKFAIPAVESRHGVSYSILNPMPGDPFNFKFSSQPQAIHYFALQPIPTVNYLPSLFCKLEYKLDTKSKLAPRFRLGSLNYTNWMEGKGDFYMRYYK